MGFFANAVGAFRKAAKAGSDFNPTLEEVLSKLEQLHGEGKLEDTLYKAEQAYTAEHSGYLAKGIHTNAADSQRDVLALRHLMTALREDKDTLDPAAHQPRGADQRRHQRSGTRSPAADWRPALCPRLQGAHTAKERGAG